jgi:hypothetical protein
VHSNGRQSGEEGWLKGRRFADLLEPGESFIAGTTFSTGSILAGVLSGGGKAQVRLGLTDRRVLMLSAGLRGGKLLRSIPVSEIVAAKNTSRQGFASPTLVFALGDGTVFRLESGPYTVKSGEKVASLLETRVGNNDVP